MPCRSCGGETSPGSSKCLTCARLEVYGSSLAEGAKGAGSRYSFIIIGATILTLILFGLVILNTSSKDSPRIEEIEEKVKDYLVSTSKCPVLVLFDSFQVVKVGGFEKGGPGPFEINGWPIYVEAEIRCQSGGINQINEVKGDQPVAYVRKTIAGYEIFLPEFFKAAQEEFQREINGVFDKMMKSAPPQPILRPFPQRD